MPTLSIDLEKRQLTRHGQPVPLSPTEWQLLTALITLGNGAPVSHRQLLTAVWGEEHGEDHEYLRVYIGRLRKKLEEEAAKPRLLLSEIGYGYRLHLPAGALQQTAKSQPATPRPLFGREQDLQILLENLGSPAVRWVTLTGTGGVGKTALARAAVPALQELFAGEVHWVDLSAVQGTEGLLRQLFEVLLQPSSANPEPSLQTLREHLQDRRMLLILDPFEHQQGTTEMIVRLLEESPDLKVLLTSRVSLHHIAEREQVLSPLDVPRADHTLSAEALQDHPAVLLFRQTMHKMTGEPSCWTADQVQAVMGLCQHLDGLPLAIELVASGSALLPLEDLVTDLPQVLNRPHGFQGIPLRHRTLRASLGASLQNLTDRQKKLLIQLAVFPATFDLGSIREVCMPEVAGHLLDDVQLLTDHHLLVRLHHEGGAVGFRLLKPLREVLLQDFTLLEDAAEVQHRFRASCAARVRHLLPALLGPGQAGALERLSQEHPNIERMFERMPEDRAVQMAELADRLWVFWHLRGMWRVGRIVLEKVLTHVDLPADLRASLHTRVSCLAWFQGEDALSEHHAKQALDLAESEENRAFAHAMLGGVRLRQGRIQEARTLLLDSLPRFHGGTHHWYQANVWYALGLIELHGQNREEARRAFMEGYVLCQTHEYTQGVAIALMHLQQVALAAGEFNEASLLGNQARALFERVKDRHGLAMILLQLGQVHTQAGQFEQAHVLLEDSLIHFQELADLKGKTLSLDALTRLALQEGQLEHAVQLLSENTRHGQTLQNLIPLVFMLDSMMVLAHLLRQSGLCAQAFSLSEQLREVLFLPRTVPELELLEHIQPERHSVLSGLTLKDLRQQGFQFLWSGLFELSRVLSLQEVK